PLVSLYRRSEDFGQWLHRLDASDVRAGQHSAHADGAELPCDGICLASALWSQRSELVVVVPLPTVTGRTVSDQMDGRVGDGACGVGRLDQLTVEGIGHQLGRLRQRQPAKVVDLLARGEACVPVGAHQEIVDLLHARGSWVAVGSGRFHDPAEKPGLLVDLSQGARCEVFSGLDLALWKGPVAVPRTVDYRHLESLRRVASDDQTS